MTIPSRSACGVPITRASTQITDYQGTPMNGPSGQTPITGAFTAIGASSPFLPVCGRDFNVTVSGTYVAVIDLERSFDYDPNSPGSATWSQVVSDEVRAFLSPSFIWNEPEYYVIYRLHCTGYTSGTAAYRISQ